LIKISKHFYKIFFFTLIIPTIASPQTSKQDSTWKPFEYFIGEWKGLGGGAPGEGTYERSYKFIFNDKFIEIKNKSVYPPSEKKSGGETHEDIGYISYDKLRKIFVLRQFHIEGFVNQYTLHSISNDRKTLVFVSESIENINPGWRARETYHIINGNEFSETFELAMPEKEFQVYSKVKLEKQNK
jgi:hypothetical protein